MTRYAVDTTYRGSFHGGSVGDFQLYVQEWRDRFRHWLHVPGSNFVVSDIAQWAGTFTGYHGFAFLVKSGVSEWLFLFGLNTGSTTSMSWGYWWGGYNATTSIQSKYFRSEAHTELGRTSSDALAFGYNMGSGSWVSAMGFTDTVNLTYGAGDFQAPAVLPTSAGGADAFMPNEDVRCFLLSDANWNAAHWTRFLFLFDDNVSGDGRSAMAWLEQSTILGGAFNYSGQGIHVMGIMGDVMQNHDPLDEQTHVAGWSRINQRGTAWGTLAGDVFYGYNLGGTLDTFNLQEHTNFGPLVPSSGTYPWNSVGLKTVSGTYWKGLISDDVIRVMGAFNRPTDMWRIFDTSGGPMEKVTASMAFMYVPGLQPFPFAERIIP
jgi:hypothetical protein